MRLRVVVDPHTSSSLHSVRSFAVVTRSRLVAEDLEKALGKINHDAKSMYPWKLRKDDSKQQESTSITKTFEFSNFSQAWAFMSECALLAEKMDHHPEWFNVYNRVEVTLTTHDCGGLSNKDMEMARKMDQYASEILPARQE